MFIETTTSALWKERKEKEKEKGKTYMKLASNLHKRNDQANSNKNIIECTLPAHLISTTKNTIINNNQKNKKINQAKTTMFLTNSFLDQ